MAFVIISILNIVGCLAIAFYFGWKLTVVTLCSSMPLIISGAFFRIRYETQFEKMNNDVFAESAKFATEAIAAFRTVSALTLEDTIIRRYETLLQDHIKKAFWKSSWTTLVFAAADSVALLCMSFVLWSVTQQIHCVSLSYSCASANFQVRCSRHRYGGGLMLNLEYTSFQYMVVYVAVMQVGMIHPPGPSQLLNVNTDIFFSFFLQGALGTGRWLSHSPSKFLFLLIALLISQSRNKKLTRGRYCKGLSCRRPDH